MHRGPGANARQVREISSAQRTQTGTFDRRPLVGTPPA
jgi:hypothetical protein